MLRRGDTMLRRGDTMLRRGHTMFFNEISRSWKIEGTEKYVVAWFLGAKQVIYEL
jgi:hypothetical protein